MMSDLQERRPLPTTTIQAAGQAVGDVTSGLSRAPLMLSIIVLNGLGIAAAVYFLNLLIQQQSKHMTEVVELQSSQFKGLIDMHVKEFDALLELASRTQLAPFSSTPLPSSLPDNRPDRRGAR